MTKRIVLSVAALLALGIVFTSEFAVAATPAVAQPALASPLTKEQAVEMALKAHPGEVTKAYEDTKKGKKTWEVRIKGDDGKKWEVYYEIATGQLIAEESE